MTPHEHYLRGIQAAINELEKHQLSLQGNVTNSYYFGLQAGINFLKDLKYQQSTPPAVAEEKEASND